MIKRLVLSVTLVLSLGLLSACDSAEERAQAHFEKGLALLKEGDIERALVELRNVFKLDEDHKEARQTYARVEMERGNLSAAYGQYLRLVEQYPEDLEGRRALALLASDLNNWDEVERHLAVAVKLAPEDPVVQSIQVGLNYRNARRDENPQAATAAVQTAEALLEANPDLTNARRVLIDDLLGRQDWSAALSAMDAALEQSPESRQLMALRLGVLSTLGRSDDIEAQLKDMAQRFPDEQDIYLTLINWYVSQGRLDAAEAYLRDRIDPQDLDPTTRMALMAFLTQNRGLQAARDEIERILSETSDNEALFRSVRAGLDFEAGNRDAAIAEMEAIVEQAEPSEQTHRIMIALANMQIQVGNAVAARALVEEILKDDPTQTAALKLKARWLIEDDRTGDAVVDLRRALDQSPRDPEIMTLLAQAYERAGNRDLMGEMLALAVEASGRAPTESLRYAAFLLQDEKLFPAEGVLQDALRLQAQNPNLLAALGNVYVQTEDWARAQHVISTLEGIGTQPARNAARELTARMLAGQNREEELLSLLSGLAEEDGNLQAQGAIIRQKLASGDVQGTLDYIRARRAEDPDNPALRFVEGAVLAVNGQPDMARDIFLELLSQDPNRENVWIALYNLQRSRGETEDADKVLTEALAALPESANLNWVKAGELESRGDIEGSIAIYEKLYKANSNSQIIANNLASLISAHREDTESLERAYNIARRLRGTTTPPFQDTYGWIAYRLGNHQEALGYLEPAADSLTEDPMVQYHLAMTYVALKRDPDALERFRKVVSLVEAGQPSPPVMDKVTAEIARITATPAADN